MNRRKHPDQPHRRRATATDRTPNVRGYRVTGRWPGATGRAPIVSTRDKRVARRAARDMATRGAVATIEQHTGHGAWRMVQVIDGPAQQRTAREATEAAAREQRLTDDQTAQAARRERALDAQAERHLDEAARLMVRPPVARTATGRPSARHTAGGRR
ncbi:hypothetical protein [Streptomyces iconiensis]|uniref:Uncharacterized protein n=1 Tax=Streptomyces iconiensis TaxID=1384038 RepID=A0ABT7A5W9_9ACTN|nr:hypothetical protein [Streptomyces iconiensis]MDJ1136241.1 hypothetical protein [Streptomyces iconiensis]